MADLIAQGPEVSQRWRRELRIDQEIVIGRQAGVWSTPWDARISREHVAMRWDGLMLHATVCASARNPIFFLGRQADAFQLSPGQHFVVGNTTFTLSGDSPKVTLDAPKPDREQIFNAAELRRIAFRDAGQRIELLGRLPEVIKGAATDSELFVRLVNLLLSGVPKADAAALLAIDSTDSNSPARVLHWDRHRLADEEFQPSQRLIQQALAKRESVLHTWTGASSRDFTATDSVDWAYCTPVPGDACRGWALYLAGRFGTNTPGSVDSSDATDIRDDIKFTELAAATLSSLRELNRLGRQQAGLSQFFAPVVMEALATEDPLRVLAPREADVSVLFCDLRGFSSTSERSGSDLLGLLERVSKALGVMTHQILEHGGVIGDFQGDAAMGFWGWPLAAPDGPQKAALAALTIRAQFEEAARQPEHPLADFRAGIGIATGKAVAGKIGTADHVKVTVFGPVVNLASRLESLTKHLNASILLDPATATLLRERLPKELGRIRRVATVRPYGLKSAVEVSELLPPESQFPDITAEHLIQYEKGLDAFQAGEWQEAQDRLGSLVNDDPMKRFLNAFIDQHQHTPPGDWDGVIALGSK